LVANIVNLHPDDDALLAPSDDHKIEENKSIMFKRMFIFPYTQLPPRPGYQKNNFPAISTVMFGYIDAARVECPEFSSLI
jgi:hypothetical protein